MLKKSIQNTIKDVHLDQSGAALITALLIVSVMSITALAVIENLRFSMKLTSNLSQREQARLYALGAEQLAMSTIEAARKANSGQDNARYPELDGWTQKPLFFPIDGGTIKGQVKDGANCFNLNALVKTEDNETLIADEVSIEKFANLLEYTGISNAEAIALANSVVDWIDTDSTPRYGGAEDADYAISAIPYRTGSTLLADVSELKVIKGFEPDMVEKLRPWLCVRPSLNLTKLNVNTLTTQDLPLVLGYLGKQFDEVAFNNILAERPVSGFSSLDEFFSLSVFGEDAMPIEQRQYYALASDFFELNAQISYYQTMISLHSILQISQGGDITVISRRYGSF